MKSIAIHHQISETQKEIYYFDNSFGNDWHYVGISYSNRDDESDVWGDEWKDKHESRKTKEMQVVAEKFGYEDVNDAFYNEPEGGSFDEECALIQRKYNPTHQKTKHGETRYYGIHWGISKNESKKYEPKLSIQQIRIEIIHHISKVNVIV